MGVIIKRKTKQNKSNKERKEKKGANEFSFCEAIVSELNNNALITGPKTLRRCCYNIWTCLPCVYCLWFVVVVVVFLFCFCFCFFVFCFCLFLFLFLFFVFAYSNEHFSKVNKSANDCMLTRNNPNYSCPTVVNDS